LGPGAKHHYAFIQSRIGASDRCPPASNQAWSIIPIVACNMLQVEYVELLRQHQIISSMSRPANPYDNASCESFMKTLKREKIYANNYRDLEHLRANIEEFIEQYYNRCRLHSALGYQPPAEFEQAAVSSAALASATMSFFRHQEDYRPDGPDALTRSGQLTAPRTIGVDESPAAYSLGELLSSRARLRFTSRRRF
jgi:Integrase core domain